MDKKTLLTQNTAFVPGEGMEFLLALLNIAALERLTACKNAGEIYPDEAFYAVMTDIEGRMSDFLRAELSYFFGSVDVALPLFSFALESFAISPTSGDLIEGLKKQSALPFFQRAKAIWEKLTDKGGIDTDPKTWQIADHYAEESKHRLVYLLEAFYKDHYIQHEDWIHRSIVEKSEHMKDVFFDDPQGFYSSYLSLDPEAFDGRANIHVSGFLQSSLFILQPQKQGVPTWIALGGNAEESKKAIASEAQKTALKFFKLMSDKTRFEMVQLLQQKRWYNEELANHLGISAATVNYHLAAMLELEIVAMVREQHRMYYSMNRDKLKRLLEMAGDSLTGDRSGTQGVL